MTWATGEWGVGGAVVGVGRGRTKDGGGVEMGGYGGVERTPKYTR